MQNTTETQKHKNINTYTNYTSCGVGEHNSYHGYNGNLATKNKNNYLLGNGNRIYISSVGIFNQVDRQNIINDGALNPYSYANHNPINNHDPSGNSSTGFYVGNFIGIITGITGVLMALPSGGASLTLTTGVAIIFEVTEVVASISSVTLKAFDNANAANIAGWVALGTGLASVGFGFAASATNTLKNLTKIQRVNGQFGIPLSGRGAGSSSALFGTNEGINGISKNSLGLLKTENFADAYSSEYVYRADRRNFEKIKLYGFSISHNYNQVPKMIEEDGLIVAQSLQGVKNYTNKYLDNLGRRASNSPRNIYQINVSGVKGVSFYENLTNNSENLLNHMGFTNRAEDTQGQIDQAYNMMEAHLDIDKINNGVKWRVQFLGSL